MILPPPVPRLPDPSQIDMKDPEALRSYLLMLTSAVAKHLTVRPAAQTAQPYVLLSGTDGNTYKVVVDGVGALVATPLGSVNDKPVPPS